MDIFVTSSVSIPEREIEFQFSRSGGPGGQNVNKVSTRVELLFNVGSTLSLTSEEKSRVFSKLGSRIDSTGVLHVSSQDSRSQWKNRELVVAKFADLLRLSLVVHKKRHATKPSHSSKVKRVKAKKLIGSRKQSRKRISPDND